MTQPVPALPPEAEAFRQAQIAEYDTYVAAAQITTENGALIYDVGHPVPASNVDGKGRVVTGRHVCNHPGGQACERFNEPTAWTDPDTVEMTAAGKKRQAKPSASKSDTDTKKG